MGVASLCIIPAKVFVLRTVVTSNPNTDIAISLIANSGKLYSVLPNPARNNEMPKINENRPKNWEI